MGNDSQNYKHEPLNSWHQHEILSSIKQFSFDENIQIVPWESTGLSSAFIRIQSATRIAICISGIENYYEGGTFLFEICLPEDYPLVPPLCYCHTIIFHPSIDSSLPPGKGNNVNFPLIDPNLVGFIPKDHPELQGWDISRRLTDVIQALVSILKFEPPHFNPECVLNDQAWSLYRKNKTQFAKNTKVWTRDYALTKKTQQEQRVEVDFSSYVRNPFLSVFKSFIYHLRNTQFPDDEDLLAIFTKITESHQIPIKIIKIPDEDQLGVVIQGYLCKLYQQGEPISANQKLDAISWKDTRISDITGINPQGTGKTYPLLLRRAWITAVSFDD